MEEGSVMHTRTSLFHKHIEQAKRSNMDTFLGKTNNSLTEQSNYYVIIHKVKETCTSRY